MIVAAGPIPIDQNNCRASLQIFYYHIQRFLASIDSVDAKRRHLLQSAGSVLSPGVPLVDFMQTIQIVSIATITSPGGRGLNSCSFSSFIKGGNELPWSLTVDHALDHVTKTSLIDPRQFWFGFRCVPKAGTNAVGMTLEGKNLLCRTILMPRAGLDGAVFKSTKKLEDDMPFSIGSLHPSFGIVATAIVVDKDHGLAIDLGPSIMPGVPFL